VSTSSDLIIHRLSNQHTAKIAIPSCSSENRLRYLFSPFLSKARLSNPHFLTTGPTLVVPTWSSRLTWACEIFAVNTDEPTSRCGTSATRNARDPNRFLVSPLALGGRLQLQGRNSAPGSGIIRVIEIQHRRQIAVARVPKERDNRPYSQPYIQGTYKLIIAHLNRQTTLE
jgi:hypothetical protein